MSCGELFVALSATERFIFGVISVDVVSKLLEGFEFLLAAFIITKNGLQLMSVFALFSVNNKKTSTCVRNRAEKQWKI